MLQNQKNVINYHYAFDGFEADNEVAGNHNSYTTYFLPIAIGKYDPRLGRWKTPDPVIHAWESPYVGFANNPILYVDPRGDDPITLCGIGYAIAQAAITIAANAVPIAISAVSSAVVSATSTIVQHLNNSVSTLQNWPGEGGKTRYFSKSERNSRFGGIDEVFVNQPIWTGVNGDAEATVVFIDVDGTATIVVSGTNSDKFIWITKSGTSLFRRYTKKSGTFAAGGVGIGNFKTSKEVFQEDSENVQNKENFDENIDKVVNFYKTLKEDNLLTSRTKVVIKIGSMSTENAVVKMKRALMIRRLLIESGIDSSHITIEESDANNEIEIEVKAK